MANVVVIGAQWGEKQRARVAQIKER